MKKKRIIIGISGASGSIYAVTMLKMLRKQDYEIHLIVTNSAKLTLRQETTFTLECLKSLCDVYHSINNIGSQVSSGSFCTEGMIIVPCSVNTMSSIACGVTCNLLSRAADVVLKEKRKLVLMVRESPLHLGHLENMLKLCHMGAIIAPPIPAFFSIPKSIDDLVSYSVGRVLNLFDTSGSFVPEWSGITNNVKK